MNAVTPNGRSSAGLKPLMTFATAGASPGPTRIWPGGSRNGFPWSGLTATARRSQLAGRSGMLDILLQSAEEAVRMASADARAARRLASEAIVSADPETRSTAERALGLAAVELGDASAAV